MVKTTYLNYDRTRQVADEKFCESTIGSMDPVVGEEFKLLFHTDNIQVTAGRETVVNLP